MAVAVMEVMEAVMGAPLALQGTEEQAMATEIDK
jgi:hypothetical protein